MFAIEVEAGDLIRVPRGTWHWFDLCADRRIRAIRLFQDPSGWTPHYTESGVDKGFEPVCFGPAYLRGAGRGLVQVVSGTDVRVLLLDIEGTTTPLSFVTGVLFPYARRTWGNSSSAGRTTRTCAPTWPLLRDEHAAGSARRRSSAALAGRTIRLRHRLRRTG